MRYTILFVCSLMLFAWGCKPSGSDANTEDDSAEMVQDTAINKYVLTPFSNSPEFMDASLTDMKYSKKMFNFTVSGDSYKLGSQTSDAPTKMCANSDQGQHIHLIVNNEPYAAKYTSEFEYEIGDGENYVLAFLSRSYHESIKTDKAHILSKVTVKDNSLVSAEDVSEAMLFYSRPKGSYIGKDTEKVMLDFYLANTEISEKGNKVNANINGENHVITTWQPYYIEGLPMGENTITLTLVDNAGQPVDTKLNPVIRQFTLKEDPTTDM